MEEREHRVYLCLHLGKFRSGEGCTVAGGYATTAAKRHTVNSCAGADPQVRRCQCFNTDLFSQLPLVCYYDW